MAVPTPLPTVDNAIRITLKADLMQSGVAVETAQFGLSGVLVHFAGNTVDWDANCAELATKVRDKWNARITSKLFWSSAVRMSQVRVDHLAQADNHVINSGFAPFTGGDAWVGAGQYSLPWETTVAVSLYGYDVGEFVQNKARKRGRFYLPPFAVDVVADPGGQMNGGNLATIHTQVLAFLNDVQGAELGPDGGELNTDYFDLRVISRGTQLKPLDPSSTPIIRCTMDSRIDSQRRRERQQPPQTAVSGAVAHS